MSKEEEYQSNLASWIGGWESVNGNPDVYIFQAYDSNYYLLAYSYDRDYGRGSFSCYDIASDEDGCYIQIGMKRSKIESEESPYGLYIGNWGSYMKN
jgi:hypothetical protein